MNEQQASMLAKTLKGAPMSCLFVLLLVRKPMGVMELARATGYYKSTVREGLEVLSGLRLAVSTGRYQGWQLTTEGYQLTFGEGENLTLPSSSSYIDSGLNQRDQEKEQLQLPNGRVKKSPSRPKRVELAPEAEELVSVMVERCSCPRDVARLAISRAIERGDRTLTRIKYDIIKWLAYCLSPQGEGITKVGYLVAARVGDSVPVPQWFSSAALRFEVELRDLEIQMGEEGGAGWL